MRAEHFIPVIDASQEDWEERSDWEERARQTLEAGHNFVIVFSPDGGGVNRLVQLLDCHPSALPESLTKWAIHGLSEALRPEDYQWLRSVYGARDVRLVEHLHLSFNRPPRLKPYLVYCEFCGIISDHLTLPEARAALAQYLAEIQPLRAPPLAAVYHWESYEWSPAP